MLEIPETMFQNVVYQ